MMALVWLMMILGVWLSWKLGLHSYSNGDDFLQYDDLMSNDGYFLQIIVCFLEVLHILEAIVGEWRRLVGTLSNRLVC